MITEYYINHSSSQVDFPKMQTPMAHKIQDLRNWHIYFGQASLVKSQGFLDFWLSITLENKDDTYVSPKIVKNL